MKPLHHQGYMVLKHRFRNIAITVDSSWFMSLPKWLKDKYLEEWSIILAAKSRKGG